SNAASLTHLVSACASLAFHRPALSRALLSSPPRRSSDLFGSWVSGRNVGNQGLSALAREPFESRLDSRHHGFHSAAALRIGLVTAPTSGLHKRATRRFASTQYFGLISKPTKLRPCLSAATATVPLPMNGSSTRPSGGQLANTMRSTISSGFWVGCSSRSGSCLWIRVTLQTSLGLQPTSSHFLPTKIERVRARLVTAS